VPRKPKRSAWRGYSSAAGACSRAAPAWSPASTRSGWGRWRDRWWRWGLKDSKQLGRGAREALAPRIREQAIACAAGKVAPHEIDRLNIHRAGLEAMRRAVAALAVQPDWVLVDARTIPDIAVPQTAIVGGDASDGTIAAASIVAKVHRDAIMRHLGTRYPGYGFDRHMGYGTEQHLEALRRLGPSPVHRRSFAPVAKAAAR
jgi:ribonuclease HII